MPAQDKALGIRWRGPGWKPLRRPAYYASTEVKTGAVLRLALHDIIKG